MGHHRLVTLDSSGSLRIGDDDRRAVDAQLQRAVGEGRLTLLEYEERSGEVWRARTRDELASTVSDLPAGAPPVPEPVHVPAPVRGRTRRVLAVMSGDELRGPVEGRVEAYAVMGGAKVDLRRDDLPARVHVRAVAVMGGIEVLVPRGVTVHLSGLSLMGGREARVDPPTPGAPVVEVDGLAVMGGIEVKHGPAGAPVSLQKAVPTQAVPATWTHDGSTRLPARPRRRRRAKRFLVAGVLLVGLAVGVPSVATADDAAVFGSRTVVAQAGQYVDAGMLFGSVEVVVPDDAPVVTDGTVVFGSLDCKACRAPAARSDKPVHVHGRGAFGSIEVVRQSQWRQDGDADR